MLGTTLVLAFLMGSAFVVRPVSAQPVAWWKFDEPGDLDDALDSAGANVGAIMGTGITRLDVDADVPGLGRAASFLGDTADYFDVGVVDGPLNPGVEQDTVRIHKTYL